MTDRLSFDPTIFKHDVLKEKLPCGCAMSTVDDAFVFEPCSLTCEYYLYVQQQMAAKGMPAEVKRR